MRRYQGGMIFGVWGYVALALLALAALTTAVIWFNNFVDETWKEPARAEGYAKGSLDQRVKDQQATDALDKKIAGLALELSEARRDLGIARENSAKCEATLEKQRLARAESDRVAKASQAATAAVAAEQRRREAAGAIREAELAKIAAAPPKLMACEAELDKAKKSLRDQLQRALDLEARRNRIGIPPAPAAQPGAQK